MDLDKLKALKNEYTTMIREKGREILADRFKRFFAENPGITAIGWRQYTPYWNDGEPCEFSVGCFVCGRDPIPEGTDLDTIHVTEEPDDGDPIQWTDDNAVSSLEREASEIEDVYEGAFGDHVQVIATRDGFHVTEYEHE